MRFFGLFSLLGVPLLAGCLWTPQSALPVGMTPWPTPVMDPERAEWSWWESFGDRTLNGLMDQALRGNLEILEAEARIRQAEAEARRSGALLFPALEGAGSLSASRTSESSASSRRGDEERARAAGVGALLRWELDLWGGLRMGRQAAIEEALAASEDARGVRVMLSAAVAEGYLTIVEERLQLALLERQRATSQTLLELTQLRYGQGVEATSLVDVLQQREQLTSTLARVPVTEAALSAAMHRLAVLLGRSPDEEPSALGVEQVTDFPELAPSERVSTSQVLSRPDLIAQWRRVAALDHRVGQAVTDRLPKVTLSASTMLVDNTNLDALVSSALADVVAPVVDGGGRRAEVDRRLAQLEEAVHAYGRLYLSAVEELKTALVNERNQRRHLALLEEQLTVAERVLRETRNRYAQGLTDFLPVLAAIERVQELERSLISNQRFLLSYRIQRHRALGGH